MNEIVGLHHPWVLNGLLLLPFVGAIRHLQQRRARVPFAPLQYGKPRRWRLVAAALRLPVEILLTALCLVGIAGPYRETHLELIEDDGIDVVLVLDVSLSMMAEDFPPNRLEALREIASDFIRRSGTNRVGIVAFAGDAFVQSPLTTDHRTLQSLLHSTTIRILHHGQSGGTAIGDALLVATERLERVKVEARDQAMILITDGECNAGIEPSVAARYVRHAGVRFYAIGIGGDEPVEVIVDGEPIGSGPSPYLAVLDDTELRAMAGAAGGQYFRAADVGALEKVLADLSRLESAPLEVRTLAIRRSFTPLFAGGSLVMFVFHLGLSGIIARRPVR